MRTVLGNLKSRLLASFDTIYRTKQLVSLFLPERRNNLLYLDIPD
jgi:hypothetical protein